MGLFNRKKDIEIVAINRDNNESSSQSPALVPSGLSFLIDNYTTNPESISAFFGGVELISNSIAEVPILVKNIEDNLIVKDHPVISALKYGRFNKFNLIKQMIHDLYLFGDGFAYIERDVNGDVKNLKYIPYNDCTMWIDEVKRDVYYTVNYINKKKIEDANMIHIFKNSKNGLTGIGLKKYASIVFPLAAATDKAALEFFDAGGNISGILQSKKNLDTEEKIEALNSWNSTFRGNAKNGNVAVIGNDFEYKQVGISQKDAQMIESRQFNVLEVCRYLNINPVLLGVNSGSSYNSIEQAQLDLVIHTLLPLIELIEEEFNKKLIRPSQRNNFYVDFDEEKIMFADRSSTANYYTTLVKNGIISINEARMSLGYTEKDGASDLIIPFTDINANKVNSDGNTDEKEDESTV